MPFNVVVPVAEQEDLGAGYFRVRLASPEIAREVRAGQFVMMGLPDIDLMLVRRPFSVARVHPDPGRGQPEAFDVLYKVFGRRTLAFSHLRPGAEMSVLGPLGRGFWTPDDDEKTQLLLAAGGIGSAPFPLLLQQLGRRAAEATLCYGGKSRADLTLLDWFRRRCRVVATTEDGSEGAPGLVTEPLMRALDAGDPHGSRVVMACGPPPMLKAVAEMCLARNVPCQISVEETMACGFGVCLGCVVERRSPADDFDRFVRVCTEGPVFDAREIKP